MTVLADDRREQVDENGAELVGEGDRRQEDAVARAGRRVEDVARRKRERLPQPLMRHERPRQGQHDGKEERELEVGNTTTRGDSRPNRLPV